MTDLAEQIRSRVVPAVPVPFDGRGKIDSNAQWDYVKWMAKQPVGGVAVWVHTGRGLLLDDEQRASVLAAWRDGMEDRPIVCGVGVPHGADLPTDPAGRTNRVTELTVRMAEAARDGGASGVMVHPPRAFAGLPDLEARLADLHSAVSSVGLPVIAFHLYEGASGLPYTPDIVRRLLAVDGVIGIKLATLDSVMTFQELATAVFEFEESLLITGEDRFLGYSLMMGAHSALIGLGAACTNLTARLVGAWFNRSLPEFVYRSAQVDEFARATFTSPMEGYVQRMLWALHADKVIDAEARDPFGPPLPDEDRAWVRETIEALKSG